MFKSTRRTQDETRLEMREFDRFMRQLGRAIEEGIQLGVKLAVLILLVIVALAILANS